MGKYELINTTTGEVISKYDNKMPRQAALKAANHGHEVIYLREVDSQKDNVACILHHFTGKRSLATKFLPLTGWRLDSVVKAAGKVPPAELNAKGKEQEFVAAGFKAPFVSTVKKVGRYKVTKIEGQDLQGCVKAFLAGKGNVIVN